MYLIKNLETKIPQLFHQSTKTVTILTSILLCYSYQKDEQANFKVRDSFMVLPLPNKTPATSVTISLFFYSSTIPFFTLKVVYKGICQLPTHTQSVASSTHARLSPRTVPTAIHNSSSKR